MTLHCVIHFYRVCVRFCTSLLDPILATVDQRWWIQEDT